MVKTFQSTNTTTPKKKKLKLLVLHGFPGTIGTQQGIEIGTRRTTTASRRVRANRICARIMRSLPSSSKTCVPADRRTLRCVRCAAMACHGVTCVYSWCVRFKAPVTPQLSNSAPPVTIYLSIYLSVYLAIYLSPPPGGFQSVLQYGAHETANRPGASDASARCTFVKREIPSCATARFPLMSTRPGSQGKSAALGCAASTPTWLAGFHSSSPPSGTTVVAGAAANGKRVQSAAPATGGSNGAPDLVEATQRYIDEKVAEDRAINERFGDSIVT